MEPPDRLAEARKQAEIVLENESETMPLDDLMTLHHAASDLARVESSLRDEEGDG